MMIKLLISKLSPLVILTRLNFSYFGDTILYFKSSEKALNVISLYCHRTHKKIIVLANYVKLIKAFL